MERDIDRPIDICSDIIDGPICHLAYILKYFVGSHSIISCCHLVADVWGSWSRCDQQPVGAYHIYIGHCPQSPIAAVILRNVPHLLIDRGFSTALICCVEKELS